MNKISAFFYNKATITITLIFTIITFGYLFFVMMTVAKGFEVTDSNNTSLGMSLGFDYETVEAFISSRSDEMLVAYKKFNVIWDNLFALLYGLMYIFWLSFLFKPYQNKVESLNLLPCIQVIFDWIENFKLAEVASSYLAGDQIATMDVQIASFASMMKWMGSILIFIALTLGIILKIWTMIKNRKRIT